MFINPIAQLALLEAKYNVDDDEENFGFSEDDVEDGFAEDNNIPENDDEDSGDELMLHGNFDYVERDGGEDSAFDLAAETEAPIMTRSKRGYLVPALPAKSPRGSRKPDAADSGTAGKDNFTAMREGDAAKLYSDVQDEIMPVLGHFSGCAGLSDRAKDILTELYGYIDMLNPTAQVVQVLVYLSEQFGIECRKSGAEPYGNPGEPVITEADIVSLYYSTAPKSVYMAHDPEAVAHIDLPEAAKLASRISNNLAGRGDADTPAMPVPSVSAYAKANGLSEGDAEGAGRVKTATLYNYLSRSSKRGGKRRETGAKASDATATPSSLSGAHYAGDTYPGEGHGRVFIGLYPVFDMIRSQLTTKPSLMALLGTGSAEDLACDVMRMGTKDFGAAHPGAKFRGLAAASSPVFASKDSESDYLVCGKAFIDFLDKYILSPACPSDSRAPVKCGIFKDGGKTRLRGDELRKFVGAFGTANGELGDTRNGVSVRIPYERVKEYVENDYMYSDGKGMHPLFVYFNILGLTVSMNSTAASDSGDEPAQDMSTRADVTDAGNAMGELVDSGNAENDVLDSRIVEMLVSNPGIAKNIRAVTGGELTGTGHKALWDCLGRYLTVLSGWMADCGSKSTAVAGGEGERPRIHIDDSEVSAAGTYRLGEAWRKAYNRAAARWLDGDTVSPDAPEGFRNMARVRKTLVWSFITEVGRWFETYSAEKWFDVDSLTAALYASPEYFGDVLEMITPDIDTRRLFGDYIMADRDGILENGLDDVTAGGSPVDAATVSSLLATYYLRIDADAHTHMFTKTPEGKSRLNPDTFGRVVGYLYDKFGADEGRLIEWASAGECPDVMNPQEWELVKLLMSGVEVLEDGTPAPGARLVPPAKAEDRLIDMTPNDLYYWIVDRYVPRVTRGTLNRFIGSMLYVAAELVSRELSSNTKDSLQKGAASALDENIPLDGLSVVFGRLGGVILAIAGHYCGDSGEALNTLASFVGRGEPAADEEEARPVAEAVEKLKGVDFLIFKSLTM